MTETQLDPRPQDYRNRFLQTLGISICVILLAASKLLGHFGFESSFHAVVGVVSLLALTGILSHALRQLLILTDRKEGNEWSWSELLLPVSWTLMAFAGFVAWPACLSPEHNPIAFLLTAGTIVTIPVVLSASARYQRRLRMYVLVIIGAYVGLGALSVIGFYVKVRPHIQGLDFYYYICYARDLIHDGDAIHPYRYAQFPGVYTFWRTVLRVAGQSLPALQWAYVFLLFANAMVVAAVIRKTTTSLVAALFGAIWYAVLCTRFEGDIGMTEPLCSLPLMCSIWYWAGRPLRGKDGCRYSVALGVGLALCLYGKQQGGLLWMGVLSLLPGLFIGPKESRHRFPLILLMSVVAVQVFLVLVLLEGQGLDPLRIGLTYAIGYETHGLMTDNVTSIVTNDESLVVAAILAASYWMFAQFYLRDEDQNIRRLQRRAVVGFAILAVVGTLVQFTRRPYLHYVLLSLPFIVIATIASANAVIERLPEHVRKSPQTALILVHLAALPLLWGSDDPRGARLLRDWMKPEPYRPLGWHEQESVSFDLTELGTIIPTGTDLLVIPPRCISIHFFLDTSPRSFAHGYNWNPDPTMLYDTVSKRTLDTVIVVNDLGPGDHANWDEFECDRAVERMKQEQYRPVKVLRSMTLWKRSGTLDDER